MGLNGFVRAVRSALVAWTALLVLLVSGVAIEAAGQNVRADQTPYFRAQVGISGYGGDLSSNTGSKSAVGAESGLAFGALGGEVGYQFTPVFGAALGVLRGTYPRAAPQYPDQTGRLHTRLMGHAFVLPTRTVSPYVQLGAHLIAGGPLDRTGGGPTGGLGLDVVLSDRFSLFTEGQADLVLPDQASDAVSANTGFDMLYFLGGGIRFTTEPAFTPVTLTSVSIPDSTVVGEEAAFTATPNAEATRPISYRWTFGDGTTSEDQTVRKSFSTAGTYSVTVTADNGEQASETRSVRVLAPPTIAELTAEPRETVTGEPIALEARLEGSNPIETEWSFGNGVGAEDAASTSVTYEAPGSYTVTLIARNRVGQDRRSVTVEIEEPYDPCEALTSLETVYFGFAESQLTDEARAGLAENVEELQSCQSARVRIRAFTDHVGSTADNLELSKSRAQAVMEYYVEQGIEESRIETEALGEAPEPCVQDTDSPGCRRNRRVESIPVTDGEH